MSKVEILTHLRKVTAALLLLGGARAQRAVYFSDIMKGAQ
jgi:hypothetical protein